MKILIFYLIVEKILSFSFHYFFNYHHYYYDEFSYFDPSVQSNNEIPFLLWVSRDVIHLFLVFFLVENALGRTFFGEDVLLFGLVLLIFLLYIALLLCVNEVLDSCGVLLALKVFLVILAIVSFFNLLDLIFFYFEEED